MTDDRNDRPATIGDVAAAAGVAASTVSRALNNPGRVNARTRERIERIAADLNYVPSTQARALSSGRTRTVGLLVPDITNPFYFDLIRGTQHQLKASGYTQLLVDTEESADVEAEALDRLRTATDGVILTASRLTDEQILATHRTRPVVTINRNAGTVPTVVIDTPTALRQAVDHLLSLGHRRLAYLGGPINSFSNGLRWKTLSEEMEARPELEVIRLGPFAPTTTSGGPAVDAVLNAGATACIAYNDLIAIGMLERCRGRGIAVPDELSIVGCDDIFGASFCHPPLTTCTAPIERVGQVATTMLLSQISPGLIGAPGNGGRPSRRHLTLVPTHLTIRDSTGPVVRVGAAAAPNAKEPA
ncbi:LacI family DNA-binding transcriptional regulator [Microlunatus speluncae]|uniref:LacI family DNA-binding transcriptional regulator n=1 Tax=Microlunatus speluncae TaxID=2594267 RepID=UPI001FECF327|nr:LacI family DNA-binding transcriptional regulator [Microlunatus speluncae]